MDYAPIQKRENVIKGIFYLVLVVIGLMAVYYLSQWLYGTNNLQASTLISGQIPANTAPSSVGAPPKIYEGGELSISFWTYISNWKANNGTRKHIVEIGGKNFSTILIGLGAFKNTLMVRVQTMGLDGLSASVRGQENISSFQDGSTASSDTSLLAPDVARLFAPLTIDDTTAMDTASQPMCDLPEIDLQRWVNVSVVLAGRSVDVYLDGKLQRSCVMDSYFKVDNSSFLIAKVLQYGGFDGYVSNMNAYNYALNPDQVYHMFMAGPNGTSTGVISWFKNLFTGGG
jgi:hypothetical protein